MTNLFSILAALMLVAAVAIIILPLKGKSFGMRPGVLFPVALVPAFAIGLYMFIGAPEAVTANEADRPVARESGSAAIASSMSLDSVDSMLGGLKARLDEEPDDAGGWLLLAKSYRHLGQSDAAANAYERAKALGKTDDSFEDEGVIVIADGPAIRGTVSIAPQLAKELSTSDTVFIFAKQSREDRIPVVALRRSVADLPMQFELTNAEAMVAGTNLDSFDTLVVTARVSRSGLATDGGPGLEVWSDAVPTRDSPVVNLVIGNE